MVENELNLEIEVDEGAEPKELAKNPDVLEELLIDKQLTYKAVADQLGVDEEMIKEQAAEFDVQPGRGSKRKYYGNVALVGKTEGDWGPDGSYYVQYEIPISVEVQDELSVRGQLYDDEGTVTEQGDLVRYMIDSQDGEIRLILDTTPSQEGRDRVFANERRLAQRVHNKHLLARPPQAVVDGIGLNSAIAGADEDPTGSESGYTTAQKAIIDTVSDHAIISFDPEIRPAVFPVSVQDPPATEDGAHPEPDDVSLYALGSHDDSAERGEPLPPKDAEKYAATIPSTYTAAYDISASDSEEGDKGTPLAVKIGLIEDVDDRTGDVIQDLGLIVTVGEDPDNDEIGVTRRVHATPAGYGPDGDNAQHIFYPPKALIHALGWAGGDVDSKTKMKVDFVPGTDGFALRPRETLSYSPLE